ncbi:ral guanine nucleotide dissociation stimulator-like 2 isoform X2 [Pelobates cultripes]|uniref:Ral guanine nucleotide dissociation stimulator-like 2 isoform X2 n=2 Tax=Pelobates cultripes TaxID=61616 RepID=A0AAD1SZB7_PELCU|nr:ral guanine nucleotide dissociation stimulator-like 2 isoform X2 [Pelobates cultripes]
MNLGLCVSRGVPSVTSRTKWYCLPGKNLHHEGEEEHEGVVYSVYLRSTNSHQAPVRVKLLRAGTLVRLVLHLLDARALGDSTYIPAFLATYRAFTSTTEVLSILLDRLESEIHKPRTDNGGRDDDVSSLFYAWMSHYPDDFTSLDPEKRKRLSLCLSRLLKSNLVARLQELSVEQVDDQEPLTPVEEETSASDPLDILIYQAGYVAEQLTSLEASLFLRVVPFECLGSVWSRRDRGGEQCDRCHSVRETVRHFNRLSGAVTSSCVRDPHLRPQQRARILEKWVKVAEECWSLRNFSSVYAIFSALQSTAVHRLKRVWAETSREIQRSYQEISDVFSERDNYARMRELLFQSQDTSDVNSRRHPVRSKDPRAAGVIPYLGVFLTDLVMLDSAIRDHLENGYLNFEKRRKEFESLSQIRLLQSVCLGYRIDTDPQFVSWFRRLPPISESESYHLSCDIEPTQDAVTTTTTVKPTVIITHCTELLASIAAPFGPSMHLVSWDTPCDRLMPLGQQQKSPSVPALNKQDSPMQTPKGILAVPVRTHRRSASCGSTINTAAPNGASTTSSNLDLHTSQDSTGDQRIIRARVEPAEENSVYKSVRISSQEKAPAVIDRILRKHHINPQGRHELVQLLPGGKELVIPGTANVFYAMSSASLDFLLRPYHANQPALSPGPLSATRMQISATFPKMKAKAGDLARALF